MATPEQDGSTEGLTQRKESQASVTRRSSGSFLGESEEKKEEQPHDFASSVPDFDNFPEYLRVGPWHPLTWVTLFAIVAWVVVTAYHAWETYQAGLLGKQSELTATQHGMLLLMAAYCFLVNAYVYRAVGWVPWSSYTMVGYVLLTLRCTLGGLGLRSLAEPLRLPCLAMALITTSLWWCVIMPIFLVFAPGGNAQRKAFLRFNFGFFLVNVHLLNTPLALLDYYVWVRPLVFFDFWLAILVALLYVAFYLFVLDPAGMHYYIIFSPRPWWSCLSYALVIGIYFGIYSAFA